jgi:hypothetical protein
MIDPMAELALRRELKAAMESGDTAAIENARTALDKELSGTSFLADNLEIPGGIGGAVGGAAIGSAILPGIGTIAGGVIGGALGSAGGSAMEDVIAGRNIDTQAAGQEALTSLKWDAALLGAGKMLRPLARVFGSTPDVVIRKLQEMATKPTGEFASGTVEAARESQALLQSGSTGLLDETGNLVRGSLTATQTNAAGRMRKGVESVANVGMLGGARLGQNMDTGLSILKKETENILDELGTTGLDDALLGKEVFGVIESGRQAASDIYGEGLSFISSAYGSKQVGLYSMFKELDAFATQAMKDGVVDGLDPAVREQVEGIMETFATPQLGGKMSVEGAIQLEKNIGKVANAMASPSSDGFAQAASVDMFKLGKLYRAGLLKEMDKLDPVLGQQYTALKDAYSSANGGLLPDNISSLLRGGNKGGFQGIGRALTRETDTDTINSVMRSVDEAFSQIKKAPSGFEAGTAFKSAEDIKNTIRLLPDTLKT